MGKNLQSLLNGYKNFKNQYALTQKSRLNILSAGQRPRIMVITCCDSRVDPGFILGCEPGDLFVVRNVANIVPPYELDDKHHGTSAALEFGIRFLKIEDLIILGHSNCGGIDALLNNDENSHNDFINNWVSIVKPGQFKPTQIDECAKFSLKQSYENCMSFPWIEGRILADQLRIHLWFFDIKSGQILSRNEETDEFKPLEV